MTGTLSDPEAVIIVRRACPLDGNAGGAAGRVIPGWLDSGAVLLTNVQGVNPEF